MQYNRVRRNALIPDPSQTPNPRKMLLTRVPVTGFLNLYESRGIVAHLWTGVLMLAGVCIAYFMSMTLVKALNSGSVINLTIHYDEDSLPFPNVSVCAPVIINRTYVRQVIRLPTTVQEWLQKQNRSEESFIDDFSTYMAYSVRVKNLNAGDLRYFDRVYDENFVGLEREKNGSRLFTRKFYHDSQPTCHKLITDCTLDGLPLDCCENAGFKLLEDEVCYTLSRVSKGGQHRPGPSGGLTFRAILERKDSAFIESDHAEGFQIHIDHVASYLNSPVAAPLGSLANLRITGRNVVRQGSCLDKITDHETQSLRVTNYYDPAGKRCKEERFMKLLVDELGCNVPFTEKLEPDKPVCSPRSLYAMETLINTDFSDLMKNYVQKIDMKMLRQIVRSAYYTDQCLPVCSDWEYDIFASYLSLADKAKADSESDEAFSEISIFYGDLSYFQYVHQPPFLPHALLSEMGGAMCLYLGLSMTAASQLIAYGIYWLFEKLKHHEGMKPFKRRNVRRVHPQSTSL